MKTFKYLRRFNEQISSGDLDFRTFQELMYDISDTYDCEFKDFSAVKDDPFYDCVIKLFKDYETPKISLEYLSEQIPTTDDPQDIDHYLYGVDSRQTIYDLIDNKINELKNLQEKIPEIISNNNKISDIFKLIELDILPRFETFDNFGECTIGFDNVDPYPEIRLCFQFKSEGNEGESEYGWGDLAE